MKVQINGDEHDVPDGLSIEGLVIHLGLLNERVAVERNRVVVRSTEWPGIALEENDQIEIIHFVGGGATRCD